jgi:hypothetical protein
MRRSTVRILAFSVLALLGAPVAMHVVLHDLHDHHDAHADAAMIDDTNHGDHEHPIVGSPSPAAVRLTRTPVPVLVAVAPQPVTLMLGASAERNALSLGALRTDDDVGLQPFLSTFLI